MPEIPYFIPEIFCTQVLQFKIFWNHTFYNVGTFHSEPFAFNFWLSTSKSQSALYSKRMSEIRVWLKSFSPILRYCEWSLQHYIWPWTCDLKLWPTNRKRFVGIQFFGEFAKDVSEISCKQTFRGCLGGRTDVNVQNSCYKPPHLSSYWVGV